MASTTGFLNINGTDLSDLYYATSNVTVPSTFSGVNTFNGTIYHRLINIATSGTYTYTSATVPNFICVGGVNLTITLGLPTTGVPDGFILYVRRNNGTAVVTYTFSPNIRNLSNTSVSSITLSATQFGFSLIKYNTAWYLHVPQT